MQAYNTNINDHFFSGSYKHAWKGLIPQGLTEAEVDFIIEMGGLESGDNVLDIMCGYGRHALGMGKRGINVTAVDNLPDYIEEIKQAADKDKLPVEVQISDVLEMQLNKQYNEAICMGNSFAFFNKNDAFSIIKSVSSHLKLHGIFIINSWMIAEIAIRHFKEKDWHYAGNYKCLIDYKFSFQPSRIEMEQTIISNDGLVETIKGVDYIFSLNELEEMFMEAGLKTKGLFSTPRKRKFSLGDSQIYIVAEKI